MKRDNEIKLRLNDEELARLNGMVERTLFSREAFLRGMLAGYRIRERPPVDVPQMIMQIRRIGITLDRLLRRAQETGFIDAPELRRAMDSNRQMEKAILEIYLPYREEE